MKFEVIKGEREDITYSGKRQRKHTVLIRVGKVSFSKRALILGAVLVLFQILDGVLTYLGLQFKGIHMEGNAFLRELMNAYGAAPVIFYSKLLSITLAVALTFEAHRRRWIRPVILLLIVIYFCLAVLPWTYIISSHHAVINSTETVVK